MLQSALLVETAEMQSVYIWNAKTNFGSNPQQIDAINVDTRSRQTESINLSTKNLIYIREIPYASRKHLLSVAGESLRINLLVA